MSDPAPPFTLRAAAGLSTTPSPLAASTLIIIDAQREYERGPLVLPGVASAVVNIARILGRARDLHVPIVHVSHHGPADVRSIRMPEAK